MNTLPSLAIIIYDDCLSFDRYEFICNLEKICCNFKIDWFYTGSQKNYNLYSERLIHNLGSANFYESIKSILFKFDYYLLISPTINLLSELNKDNFAFDKINYFNNLGLFFFTNKANFVELFYQMDNFGINFLPSINCVRVEDKLIKCYERHHILKDHNIPKLGLILTGISHDDGNFKSGWNVKFNRSFLNCYQNHFDKIIKPFEKSYLVETFIATYNSEKVSALKQIYVPKNCVILEGSQENQRTLYIKSIEAVLNLNTNVDFFICTRFDIKFYNELTSWDIDYNKFNFLFKENWGSIELCEVSDVIFAFPSKFLKHFYEALVESDKNPRRTECVDLHHLYDFVKYKISEENIHFICKESQSTANATFENQKQNSFFYLCRSEILEGDN